MHGYRSTSRDGLLARYILRVCSFGISLRCEHISKLKRKVLRFLLYSLERNEAVPLIGAG